MKRFRTLLERLRDEQSGQSLVEYGAIVTLIAVGCLSLLSLLYDQVAAMFGQVVEVVTTVSSGF